MNNNSRKKKWTKNINLEKVLTNLNNTISDSSSSSSLSHDSKVCFVYGSPRSGTSLFMQVMASSGFFSYPSNIISRFYSAPHIGEMVQKILIDPTFDHMGELSDIQVGLSDSDFKSSLGKTKGALNVNEFWYFWRRFFSLESGEILNESNKLNLAEFKNAIGNWYEQSERTIVLKALIANWNMLYFAKAFPHSHHIIIRREPVATAISLLNARLSFWGDTKKWYSFQLPLECRLMTQNAFEEVALQVACHDVLLDYQMKMLAKNTYTEIHLKDLIDNPTLTLAKVIRNMNLEVISIPEISLPKNEQYNKKVSLSEKEVNYIQYKYDEFKNSLKNVVGNLYNQKQE